MKRKMIANTHLIGTHGKGKDEIALIMKQCFHEFLHPQTFGKKVWKFFIFIYSFTVSLIEPLQMVKSILNDDNDSIAKVKI